jgi:hypothetical protein
MNRSDSVWQQQERQHLSAEPHPHELDAQGNSSPPLGGAVGIGRGMPDATKL